MERRVLLVVDAHVGRRGELRRLLARTAVAVVHAEDPPDAVLRLEESKPANTARARLIPTRMGVP